MIRETEREVWCYWISVTSDGLINNDYHTGDAFPVL